MFNQLGGTSWGWVMFLGMSVFSILVFIALILLIIWLAKQIQKK